MIVRLHPTAKALAWMAEGVACDQNPLQRRAHAETAGATKLSADRDAAMRKL